MGSGIYVVTSTFMRRMLWRNGPGQGENLARILQRIADFLRLTPLKGRRYGDFSHIPGAKPERLAGQKLLFFMDRNFR